MGGPLPQWVSEAGGLGGDECVETSLLARKELRPRRMKSQTVFHSWKVSCVKK